MVVYADRSKLPRRDNEPTGEAESLWGKIDLKKMGDRASRNLQEIEKLKEKKRKVEEKPKNSAFSNILAATEDFEGLNYRPRTKETRTTYELILAFLSRYLGDVQQDVLASATDLVIEILKDESKKDFDRKREIEDVLGAVVAQEQFSTLINLGKRITDYGQEQARLHIDDGTAKGEMDEEYGVAVVFEDEEEEEDEFEVKDEEPEEEGEEANAGTFFGQADDEEEEKPDDFTTVLTAEKTGKLRKVNPKQIDRFWHQRLIASQFDDPITAQSKSNAAFEILESAVSARDAENELMALFDYEKFDLVKALIVNRDCIVWVSKLKSASEQDIPSIREEMISKDLEWILQALDGVEQERDMDVDMKDAKVAGAAPRETVDLEALAFHQGGHLMTNKKVRVPDGTVRRNKKGYEEVHVPAPLPAPMKNEKLIPISDLPQWAQPAFAGAKSLNRVQSKVYPTAFQSDENMLLCAPTGAGKTNCAMLTIMREIGRNMDEEGNLDLDNFKIVYVAPMKALVAEMVGNFSSRLKSYGIKVAELTGDRQLTKQQIAETQIIVTTPEKWDIITRKATDRSYTKLVRLLIVDEIHLLHDDRGPVLEAIISRTLRMIETSQEMTRIVGLSATLPNYKDVATFMRVDLKTGLLFFDGSYRPCPLKQQYIGITEKKGIKRLQMMNEICYEKIMEEVQQNPDNQILVFCHSRKETAKTAKALRDLAIQKETIGYILKPDAASREILVSEAENVKNDDLKDLLPFGFAIHHAGMNRQDRTLVEELFADKHIPILVSTATLAWGVNLPAHTVIIKGTQVYNPEKGRWTELSPQDMLQMLGRAGRPQYDTFGEGIIITSQQELQYYLSLLNEQLPIESQMISKLPDILNAEIVMGNVRNRQEAVDWLGYSYLYVRMLRNGGLYGVTVEDAEEDPYLIQKRIDLVHAAANVLERCSLIKYDKKTGNFQGTELGRIASYYYISHNSMSTYNQHLKPTLTIIDLFRVFALSQEFKLIPVRQEEKMELAKLLERVPIPIKETMDDPVAKLNCLLQAYISQLKLDGFALMSDMVYVTQSAGRILRAIFEICLRRGWAQLARSALDLCKMVDKRCWLSMTPLRQFPNFPEELIRKIERKDISWDRYYDLTPQELGELVSAPKAGKNIHKFIHEFPKLDLQAHVQPVTRSLVKVELVVHHGAETFWIFVEDVDGEHILYSDQLMIKERYGKEEHIVSFFVPLYEPLAPNYFISLISDRWLHAETRLPVSFKHLILPEKYPPHTELLDLEPLPVTGLKRREFESLYDFQTFNPIQTQTYHSLFATDENTLICAPVGSGKTVCAEFALLRLWTKDPKARCVYVCPYDSVVDKKKQEWSKFTNFMGGKNIVKLTGELAADLKLLEQGDIVFATPHQWDALSRKWKQRKNVATVGLFVMDDIHLIGSQVGPTIEVIVSRMRYIAVQTEHPIRILCLGASLANARDVGDWIGAPSSNIFNFHPSVRPIPLEIHIQGYNIPHFPSLMLAMNKPTFLSIKNLAQQEPAIVFVPSRKQARMTAVDLLTLCVSDGDEKRFLHCSEQELAPFLENLSDRHLQQTIKYGIAFYHEALSPQDRTIVEDLFRSGAVQVLVSSRESCWQLNLKSKLVVIMGSQFFQGKEHRYVDYPVVDVLQMMGCAAKDDMAYCVLMCQQNKKEFYKKFLHEALPVESHLDHFLHDHFNAEIVTKTIENKQDANLEGVTHRHLSDFLSELVETTLEDLQKSNCVLVEEDDVSPLDLGLIAAYYYISYMTIEAFSLSLKPKTKMRGLLEIISAAAEFEDIPIRHHEDQILRRIYERVPLKVDLPNFNDPHFKTNLLLQSHFARIQLTPDLEADQKQVLQRVIRLLQACVDVISSNGWLGPALTTMELSQMVVQAVWDKDSPLKQLPFVSQETIDQLKQHQVEGLFDLMEMDDNVRNQTLQLDKSRMAQVARYVNRYPNIEVQFSLEQEKVPAGDNCTMTIQLEREADEEDVGPVIAPYYPLTKDEGWWLVIGDPANKALLGIKRVHFLNQHQLELDFSVPEKTGQQSLKLYLMCDSYMGVDQEFEFQVQVEHSSE
ncbi:Sec63 Brl domain-containing protein [Gorgonomyces haynaldii]|nr:Sec63 Brl domain-containing protein [Gorgonomyces haynaldii]